MGPRQEETPKSSSPPCQDREDPRTRSSSGSPAPAPPTPDLQAQSCEEPPLLCKPPGLCSSQWDRVPAASGTGRPAL